MIIKYDMLFKELKLYTNKMTIVIDGNIGAGKSTQLDLLGENGYTVRKEPVGEWPLEKFYRNPSEWAFLFQVAVTQSNLVGEPGEIIERGILPGRMVFWEDMMIRGVVKNIEEHYWYDKLWNSLKWFPDIYIFIDTSPEVAMGRIKSRKQSGDRYVDIDSLSRLRDRYMEMLAKIKKEVRVIIIDGDRPKMEIHEKILKIIQDHRGVNS